MIYYPNPYIRMDKNDNEKFKSYYNSNRDFKRIVNNIKNTTNIYIRLEELGLEEKQIENIINTTINFTLKNINVYDNSFNTNKAALFIVNSILKYNESTMNRISKLIIADIRFRVILERIVKITLRTIKLKSKPIYAYNNVYY